MKIIAIIWLILTAVYLFDKICLWLEDHDLLYYRRKKSPGGFSANALLELQTLLNPSARYMIEMKQNTVRFKKSESHVPSDVL